MATDEDKGLPSERIRFDFGVSAREDQRFANDLGDVVSSENEEDVERQQQYSRCLTGAHFSEQTEETLGQGSRWRGL